MRRVRPLWDSLKHQGRLRRDLLGLIRGARRAARPAFHRLGPGLSLGRLSLGRLGLGLGLALLNPGVLRWRGGLCLALLHWVGEPARAQLHAFPVRDLERLAVARPVPAVIAGAAHLLIHNDIHVSTSWYA